MNTSRINVTGPKESWHWVALLLLIVTTVALRFYDLDSLSLWEDEAWSWFQSDRSFAGMVAATARDNYPPLHNIILNFTIRFFGDSETALRVPSAVLGVLGVFLTYLLGSALWDRTTGLLACLLITFSGFHICYSQEARMYTLLSCTAVYYVLTLVHAIDSPSRKRLGINAAAGVMLLFSHIYGSFIFAGVNLFMLAALLQTRDWTRLKLKDWIIAQAVAAVMFLPWVPIMLWHANRIRDEGFWIPDLSVARVLGAVASGSGGLVALIVLSVLCLLAVSSLWLLNTSDRRQGVEPARPWRFSSVFVMDWRIGLVLSWFFASLFFGIVTSLVIDTSVLYDRYLIGSLPALLLLAALGIRKLQFSMPLMFPVLILAALSVTPAPDYPPRIKAENNTREIILSARPELLKGDQLFVYLGWKVPLFEYYLQGSGARVGSFEEIEAVEGLAAGLNRFWILASDLDDSERTDLLERAKKTHKLAFSLKNTKSQAYLFVRNANPPAG